MDVDMTLDEMTAAAKQENKASRKPEGGRKPSTPSAGPAAGRGGKDRIVSGGRRDAPYSRPPPASTGSSWTHDMYENKNRGPPAAAGGNRAFVASRAGVPPQDIPSSKIRIENVHYDITAEQLERIFSQAGAIVDGPTILYDRSGRSRGIAFITYSTLAAAVLAKEKLSGQKANGQPITIVYVRLSLPKPVDPATVGRLQSSSVVESSNAGKPLLGRLGGQLKQTQSSPAAGTPTAARSSPASSKPTTPKSVERERAPRGVGGGAGGRGGRGGARAERGGKGGAGAKRGPVNQDALDKELESFMNAPAPSTANTGEAAMESDP